jgi:hypothetical protein
MGGGRCGFFICLLFYVLLLKFHAAAFLTAKAQSFFVKVGNAT